MAAQVVVAGESERAGGDEAGDVAALFVADACEQCEQRGRMGWKFGLCGAAALLAIAEAEVVGSDVLVERGFGLEGGAAGVVAIPGTEVVVLGLAECVGVAEESELLLVNGLDVDGEVVLSVEDAVAVRPGTGKLRLFGRIRVHRVEVGSECTGVLELLPALCAFRWMMLLGVRSEFLEGCERDGSAFLRWVVGVGAGIGRQAKHTEMALFLVVAMHSAPMPPERSFGLEATCTLAACVWVHKGARIGLDF